MIADGLNGFAQLLLKTGRESLRVFGQVAQNVVVAVLKIFEIQIDNGIVTKYMHFYSDTFVPYKLPCTFRVHSCILYTQAKRVCL